MIIPNSIYSIAAQQSDCDEYYGISPYTKMRNRQNIWYNANPAKDTYLYFSDVCVTTFDEIDVGGDCQDFNWLQTVKGLKVIKTCLEIVKLHGRLHNNFCFFSK